MPLPSAPLVAMMPSTTSVQRGLPLPGLPTLARLVMKQSPLPPSRNQRCRPFDRSRPHLNPLAAMPSTPDQLPIFCGGPNIAIKIPPESFEETLVFYRDVLRLPPVSGQSVDHMFHFGSSVLWLDRVEGIETAEVWLEIATPDTASASAHLTRCGVERCDSVEKLPDGFDGFWIRSPASMVHLVTGK